MRRAAERLDTVAAIGNPTGGGIHAKWLLGRGWGDVVSSGAASMAARSAISYKVNRDVVLLVEHPLLYERLLESFLHDWALITAKNNYLVQYHIHTQPRYYRPRESTQI
jgi:hypothetical protein